MNICTWCVGANELVRGCELHVINAFGPFESKTIHGVRKLNQNIWKGYNINVMP